MENIIGIRKMAAFLEKVAGMNWKGNGIFLIMEVDDEEAVGLLGVRENFI